MDIIKNISVDTDIHGGGASPPSTGLTPDVLPEVQMPVLAANSHTGVTTRSVPLPKELQEARRALRTPHWYVLRCTYGREKQACEYIINNKGTAYCPQRTVTKIINGKRTDIHESYLPNILFAYGTFDNVKTFVYDNERKETKPLRFYYRHIHAGSKIVKEPLIVPSSQIESLKIICASESDDILLVPGDVHKFEKGQQVRIIKGKFKGVTGNVARYQGQQRVGVIIDGLLTMCTAYIPSAFLESIENKE